MGSKNGKTDCNHKGKWLGLGAMLITAQAKLFLLQSIFCSECGKTKIDTLEVPIPKSPGITVPEMVIPKSS